MTLTTVRLTAEQRARLRHEISRARLQRALAQALEEGPLCSECGTELDNCTLGCKRCSDRHLRRRKANTGRTRPTCCTGCGCNFSTYTSGCPNCQARVRKLRQRIRLEGLA